jgi:GTP cyclohydrolase I
MTFRNYLVHVLGYTVEEAFEEERNVVNQRDRMDANVEARRAELEAQSRRERVEREDGLRPDLSIASDEDIVREYIKRASFGQEDCRRPGMIETPARVVRSWADLYWGYTFKPENIKELLKTFPEDGADQMVVQKGIAVWAWCEHHLLSFKGTAAVGYIPSNRRVVGLSKLARLVQIHSHRFSTQEHICHEVVCDLVRHLDCRGAGCIIAAGHQCMMCRGALEPESVTVTSALRGVMRDDDKARGEFLRLAGY